MDKKNYKDMWVYIEHDGSQVHPVSFELCCETRKLCDQSGDKLVAVVAGELPESELDKIKDCGVDKLILVSGTGYERYNTEAYTNLFTVLCRKYNPSAVMVGGTTNGRDFAPRFAARLETGCTSDTLPTHTFWISRCCISPSPPTACWIAGNSASPPSDDASDVCNAPMSSKFKSFWFHR